MKRLITIIFSLMIITSVGLAQNHSKNSYDQLFTKLYKKYSEAPQDIIILMDMAEFYSDTNKNNAYVDLPKAKKYIDSAEYYFRKIINDKDEAKAARNLIKKGIKIEPITELRNNIIKIARTYVKNTKGMSEIEIGNFSEAFATDLQIIRAVEHQRIYIEWENTQRENSFDAYVAFQKKYPNTKESEIANDKMKQLAQQLFVKCKTNEEIDKQLEPYKEIPAVVQTAIQHKAHIAYLQAEKNNTIKAYRKYIKQYPSGDDYAKAMNKISELLVSQFSTLTSTQDLVDFISMNEDSPMADQAMNKLRNKILYEQDLYALDLYLKNFPLDPKRNNIYHQYYEWHVYEGDLQPIIDFEKANPDFPFELAIRRDMRLAEQRSDIDLTKPYHTSQFEKYASDLRRLTGYGLAYVTLQRIIQPLIAQKNWKGALSKLDYFMLSFENNDVYRYQTLKQMLQAPTNPQRLLTTEVTPSYNMTHPIVNKNGNTLYYTRVDGNKSVIWTASHINKKSYKWIGNEPLKFSNDSNIDLTLFCLYDNETKMLLGKNNDIYTAELNGDVWTLKEPMPSPVNTPYIETDAFMLPDGSGILLASDRPYGHNFHRSGTLYHGDTALATDIYYIPYNIDGWGDAINLGLTINGSYCDRSPVMSKDMKTLYFISDGAGFGYGDVFKTYRENITDWTHWQTPENLGKEVNTGYRESSVSISGDDQRLYISSNRNKNTYGCYSLASQHEKGASMVSVKIDGRSFGENLQYLGIVDLTTHTLVLSIDIEMPENTATLYGDRDYALVAEINGKYFPATIFTPEFDSIIKPEEPYNAERLIATTLPMPLRAVSFNENSRSPYDYSIREIQRLGRFLEKNPDLRIELSINANGEDDMQCYNLSLERGRKIKRILTDSGVSSNQISISAFGNLNYKKDAQTAEVYAKFNRL